MTKTVVVPVIVKADTCTTRVRKSLTTSIAQDLYRHLPAINMYLGGAAEGEDVQPTPSDYEPMCVITSDDTSSTMREYPWGTIDITNPAHCDLVQLQESVLLDWRDQAREYVRDVLYENWRTTIMQRINSKP